MRPPNILEFFVAEPLAACPARSTVPFPRRQGPPVLVSLPHFCEVDPAVAAALEGMACDPQRHNTFLDVEPTTGGCAASNITMMRLALA